MNNPDADAPDCEPGAAHAAGPEAVPASLALLPSLAALGAPNAEPPAPAKPPINPKIALLKALGGRVAPAAEHFARAQSQPGTQPPHAISQAPADSQTQGRAGFDRGQTLGHSQAPDHAQTAPPHARPSERARPRLPDLAPGARTLAFPSGSVSQLATSTALDGSRTALGWRCPADAYGSAETWLAGLATLARDDAWRSVDPTKILFIDTETTGIAGGSGVVAMLIGFGWFEGGRFELEQLFLEDFHHEPALIEAAAARFEAAEAIVSYNGRTFDMPLLETRWRMARRKPRFPALHLDLLHAARRLWRLRLPSCGLGVIEREILGILRYSDVPGAEIPRLYFDYVRGFKPERFLPVLDHHAQDILSLGVLARAMAHAVNEPDDPRFAHASEQWGLSLIYDSAGRAADADARLEHAILACRDEELGFKFAMRLARRFARAGRWDEAVEIWRARAPQARPHRLDPLIELAKHAERRLRDLDEARRWTSRALEIARSNSELREILGAARPGPNDATVEPILKRLDRIDRKLRGRRAAGDPV